MTIYVSNLDFYANNTDLKNLFTPYGEVNSAIVARDKFFNRSRGFGFVEMQNEAAGYEAITKLNGLLIEDKVLIVDISKPRKRMDL
jgi:RNA recognition motif-containing protein